MAATLDQLIRIVGGARIKWRGNYFYTKDAVEIRINMERLDAENSYGAPTPLLARRWAEISFTPQGAMSNSDLGVLFGFPKWTGSGVHNTITSYGVAQPGQIIFPMPGTGTSGLEAGGDQLCDCLIEPVDSSQKKYTFYNALNLRPPEIYFGLTKTCLGRVTLTAIGLLADATVGGTAGPENNHLFASAAAGALSDFTISTPSVDRFYAAWGAVSGFTSMWSEDGFTFSVEPQLEDLAVDGFSVPLYMIQSIRASIRMRVGNLSSENVATLLRANNAADGSEGDLGSVMHTASTFTQNLTLQGSIAARKVVLHDARVFTATPVWELRQNRSGELTFENVRQFSANTGLLDTVFDSLAWTA